MHSLSLILIACALLIASAQGAVKLYSDSFTTNHNAPLHSFANGVYIGAAINSVSMNDPSVDYIIKNRKDYNMFVAENECKFGQTETTRGVFDFAACDAIFNFANNLGNSSRFRGHNLVWADDTYNPSWLTEGGFSTNELYSKGKGSVMEQHIVSHIYLFICFFCLNSIDSPFYFQTTVAGRYKGQTYAWDVVNEALLYNDTTNELSWRTGTWRRDASYSSTEKTYVDYAFQYARAADPKAKLFYNDYGGEACGEGKSDAIYRFVQDLKRRGVPIDGVGLQTHIDMNAGYITQASVGCNIKRLGMLGLEVHITELDVTCGSTNVACDQRQQAYMYQQVLLACLQYKQYCKAFLTWGYTDKYSWKSSQNPLTENAKKEKVAWHEVQAVLRYSGFNLKKF
ncbi:glycoside hydrolase superfamily [Endogone sp. FLAS-F59071]|nr:glycoside hydrolase superfamily [Endogone sp. FLAS-F59071]|eukprot:RUS14480.1 glycoside hydrolase superfamily [Endogone sp. FLAS-F59071]